MFLLAILIGIYAYGFFFLGIVHMLSPFFIVSWTLIVFLFGLVIFWKNIISLKIIVPKDILSCVALFCLLLLGIINFIGVLGPETSFDGVWYHLTFPKIYLQNQSITYIPGGLLYYSLMPKLGELLFIPALFFGNEILAKAIQYTFGILTTIAIYKIARRYVSPSLSLIASLVFYSNIVVSWESTTAYIDLIRAFYETMALWGILLWCETQKKKWLYLSAVLLGVAISTKVLALGSLCIFVLLMLIIAISKKIPWKKSIANIVLYLLLALLIPLPWFIFSFLNTGNLFYPFFTPLYPIQVASTSFFFQDFVTLFLFLDDPISPIYLIVLPVLFVSFTKVSSSLKIVGYYVILAVIFWYFTPRTGGGRFILPYLPAWSLLVVAILNHMQKQHVLYKVLLVTIFLIAFLTIGYRAVANSRYIPVLLGKETKQAFLINHLNFSYGDFYDTDGYFKTHIEPSDKVLLYGFHNLYYVDFPFIDVSWVKKGDKFTYIATQKTTIPKRFKKWELVYENPKTFVKLYKPNKGGIWEY